MLPLKNFSLLKPDNLAELKIYLARADNFTKIIAGGTDLLPNLKHGLYDIKNLISLRNIQELYKFILNSEELVLGANISLDRLSKSTELEKAFPSLVQAASHVASPQIRSMATVGGNICLDTRCCYFNQSAFWRKALGYCLKKDGDVCHVVTSGKRCVAASSNDVATILLAYNAEITIFSSDHIRVIKLEDFYTPNGLKNNILKPSEIVSEVRIKHKKNMCAGFAKLRHRESIDFPLLSIGVAFGLDKNHNLESGRLVINAVVAKPKIFELSAFRGLAYTQALVKSIAKLAREKCHPQTNISDDCAWRKEMIEYYTIRAFEKADAGAAQLCY